MLAPIFSLFLSDLRDLRATKAIFVVGPVLSRSKSPLGLLIAGLACTMLCGSALAGGGGPISAYTGDLQFRLGQASHAKLAEAQTHSEAISGEAEQMQSLRAAQALRQAHSRVDLLGIFDNSTVLDRARRLSPAEVLVRFDRNQDGSLDAIEAKHVRAESQAREARMEALTQRFDDNQNGRLDAAEMSRARTGSNVKRRKNILRRYDMNGNGVLDPHERQRVTEDRAKAQGLTLLVPRFDQNGNRELEAAERRSLVAFLVQSQLAKNPAPQRGLAFGVGSSLEPARKAPGINASNAPLGSNVGTGNSSAPNLGSKVKEKADSQTLPQVPANLGGSSAGQQQPASKGKGLTGDGRPSADRWMGTSLPEERRP